MIAHCRSGLARISFHSILLLLSVQFLFRVNDLSNPAKKFKVETNANQLMMTGCVVLFKDCNVVVVEGGPKQINKYNKLMTRRIKWEEDVFKHDESKNGTNRCYLVWKVCSS